MKASDLLQLIQDAIDKHGDLDVEIRDTDNGISYLDVGAYEDHATEAEKEEGIQGTFTIEFYTD